MARKRYNITTYELGPYQFDLWTEDTSYGFRHLGQLSKNFRVIGANKATYYNRSWESYDYQTVIHKLIDGSEIEDKAGAKKTIDDMALGRIRGEFSTLSAVMALGDIFGGNRSESADWKLRMLKAGVPEGAISLPEDWDTLSDEEKNKRLDAIIKEFQA